MSHVAATRRREVLDRDGWWCQMPVCLCPDGRAIDPALAQGDPWAATVDHVEQRARGGGNPPGNLRAAHAACNREAAATPLRRLPRPAGSPASPFDRIRQAERDWRAAQGLIP